MLQKSSTSFLFFGVGSFWTLEYVLVPKSLGDLVLGHFECYCLMALSSMLNILFFYFSFLSSYLSYLIYLSFSSIINSSFYTF